MIMCPETELVDSSKMISYVLNIIQYLILSQQYFHNIILNVKYLPIFHGSCSVD